MALLDPVVYAAAKANALNAFDQTAQVLRRAGAGTNRTSDGGMGETWTPTAAGVVPAMLTPYFGRRAGRDIVQGAREENLSFWQILLPAGTDVKVTDRVQLPPDSNLKNNLFRIVAVAETASYEMERRVLAAKLQ